MADISTGADAVVDEIFSYQKVNKLKNHYYAAAAPANPVAGVIWIDSDDDLAYRYDGAAWATIGAGGDFSDGGEVGGAKRTLGNTDANIMAFITSNNDGIIISAAGEVTKPLQSAFHAYSSVNQPNATGDGTQPQVIFGTEKFDQNGDFVGSTFTAPVTGKYLLITAVKFSAIGAGHVDLKVFIDTSNESFLSWDTGGEKIKDSGNVVTVPMSSFCDMDAADTATISVLVAGGGKTVGVSNGASSTWFAGVLIC